jgi:hypothetical protein
MLTLTSWQYQQANENERNDLMARAYLSGGVAIDPMPPATGSNVIVKYNGLLAQSGADQIYLHYGYGFPDHWFGVKEVEMKKEGDSFVSSVKVEVSDAMHFCFRDPLNNWDNNNGANWNAAVNSNNLSYA